MLATLSLWADDSFDAVLSLGPFYHLPDTTERHRAAVEMGRVLRSGGMAFVALMPRYAFLRRTMAIPDERHHLTQPGFVPRLLEDGVFINDIPGRFTHGYGVRPEDVGPFFTIRVHNAGAVGGREHRSGHANGAL